MLAARLWRNYDLAVTTQAGDRPTFLAVIAGRKRVGPVEDRLIGRIKKLHARSSCADGRGRASRGRRAARLRAFSAFAPVAEVVCPRAAPRPDLPSRQTLCGDPCRADVRLQALARRGLARGRRRISPGKALRSSRPAGPAKRSGVISMRSGAASDVRRLDGKLTWPELTAVLAGARAFIGPDTSVTHLAAAAGCPTVALYGPTDPRLWGPWPANGLDAPWNAAATSQQRGNVWLVQNPLPCQPCQHEGCLRQPAKL